MSLLSEVKCGRCDRRYSGLRSRCPYCGASRNKKGKYAPDESSSKAKLIIGLVLLLVLIAAVVLLVLTSMSAKENAAAPNDTTPSYNNDEGVTSMENDPSTPSTPDDTTTPDGTTPDDTATPDDTTPPDDTTVQTKVESLAITYLGTAKDDITMSKGEELQLAAAVTPEGAGDAVEWSVLDTSIATVLQSGKVTALKSGTTTLRITCGGITKDCILRVN